MLNMNKKELEDFLRYVKINCINEHIDMLSIYKILQIIKDYHKEI